MNQNQTEKQLFSIFFKIIIGLLVLCSIGAIALGIVKAKSADHERETETTDIPANQETVSALLPQTPDAGLSYQNKLFFFGESTTAHLARNGGILAETRQVLKDDSGTRTLSLRTPGETVNYISKAGETKQIPFSDAIRIEAPEYLVLSFGLNRITSFINDKDTFLKSYRNLISAVKEASPGTKIILQSVYPVNENCNIFSVDAETVNSYINTLNSWILELAESEKNVRYADTASVLKDGNGMLKSAYDNGDGHHLTNSAYQEILIYLRTHAYP